MTLDFTRLDTLRAAQPLLHCIANIVTASDCANLALAAGASPIMAHAPEEAADIAARCDAAVLNIGTPTEALFRGCGICGETMRRRNRPLVLDPVGVGASPWRLAHVQALLERCPPTLVKANYAEVLALLGRSGSAHGVDSAEAAPECARDAAAALSRKTGGAVLITGKEDLIAEGNRVWHVSGGSPRMRRITGAGCMLSVLCGAFAAVEPDIGQAAVLASAFWKLCACQAERSSAGLGSFHTALFDAAGSLTGANFSQDAAALGIKISSAEESL